MLVKGETFNVVVPAAAGGAPAAWVKLNAGQHAPFRVAYDDIDGLAKVRHAKHAKCFKRAQAGQARRTRRTR